MSKMFGGIKGIMASDSQSRHGVISDTIIEKRREGDSEEDHTLMTSADNHVQERLE